MIWQESAICRETRIESEDETMRRESGARVDGRVKSEYQGGKKFFDVGDVCAFFDGCFDVSQEGAMKAFIQIGPWCVGSGEMMSYTNLFTVVCERGRYEGWSAVGQDIGRDSVAADDSVVESLDCGRGFIVSYPPDLRESRDVVGGSEIFLAVDGDVIQSPVLEGSCCVINVSETSKTCRITFVHIASRTNEDVEFGVGAETGPPILGTNCLIEFVSSLMDSVVSRVIG